VETLWLWSQDERYIYISMDGFPSSSISIRSGALCVCLPPSRGFHFRYSPPESTLQYHRDASVVVLPSNERPSSYWKDMSFISKFENFNRFSNMTTQYMSLDPYFWDKEQRSQDACSSFVKFMATSGCDSKGFRMLFLFFKIRNIPAEMGSKFFSCTHYPHTLTISSV
jgi:hypothetical protein